MKRRLLTLIKIEKGFTKRILREPMTPAKINAGEPTAVKRVP